MASFFTYFTSGFGTLVIVAILAAVFTGQRIDMGVFGILGFPLLAFLYALSRKMGGRAIAVDAALEAGRLHDIFGHPRYPEFLAEDPERRYIYKEDLPDQFSRWLSERESKARPDNSREATRGNVPD